MGLMWKTKIEDIPKEVMQEKILSRLPITSLFQSRYVSPTWRDLINEPRFSKLHHTHCSQNPSPTNLILLDDLKYCVYYIPDLNTCEKAIELTQFQSKPVFKFKRGRRFHWEIVGSVNGFLCFHSNGARFVICNPVIGDFVKLPNPARSFRNNLHGFGWNMKSNEYKVIIMHEDACSQFLEVQIHTIGSNDSSWKNIGTIPNNISWKKYSGVYVDGHIHWPVIDKGLDYVVVNLMAINLEDESLGEVSVPHCMKGKIGHHSLELNVLGGHLMITDFSFLGSARVWVMKEYCVNESWTLIFVIPFPVDFRSLKPLGLLNDGSILLACGCGYYYSNELFSYDPNTKTHEFFGVNGLPERFRAYTHLGALVTFKDAVTMEEV